MLLRSDSLSASRLWLVIDSVSIYLYLDRALYLTALLFAVYVVIVVFGYRKWLIHYRALSS